MTRPDEAARMVQVFERHNAPDIRRDRWRDIARALRPAAILIALAGGAYLAAHLFVTAWANAAMPVTPLF